MSNEVSKQFVAALAIREDSPTLSGVSPRPFAVWAPSFAIGRLLSLKKRIPDPKAVIGTLTSVCELHNCLQVNRWGILFLLKFSRSEECRHLIQGGPWFRVKAYMPP
ncbi:hypothetical protein ACLB2K_059651 [Fragaria x ananassa]